MNWGQSIILVFILFAGIIITLVTISMKQDVNLVADDYYKEEIAYQKQIDRQLNYQALNEKPEIKKEGDQVILTYPASIAEQIEDGEIHFFRPSDKNFDKKYKVKLDNNHQMILPYIQNE